MRDTSSEITFCGRYNMDIGCRLTVDDGRRTRTAAAVMTMTMSVIKGDADAKRRRLDIKPSRLLTCYVDAGLETMTMRTERKANVVKTIRKWKKSNCLSVVTMPLALMLVTVLVSMPTEVDLEM